MDYLKILVIALIVILVAKFVFKVGGKTLIGLVVNAVVGFVVLWIINWTGLVSIPMNIVTWLVAGAFGVPGVVILIVLAVLGVI